MLRRNTDGLKFNAELIHEDPFPLLQSQRHLGYSRGFIEYLVRVGKRSPKTQKLVQLEVCFMPNGALGTSRAAFQRYYARFNGTTAELHTTKS